MPQYNQDPAYFNSHPLQDPLHNTVNPRQALAILAWLNIDRNTVTVTND